MNFKLLTEGLDVSKAYKELRFSPYWDVWTVRQDVEGSEHKDTRCIPLYAPEVINQYTIYNEIDAYETIFVPKLPETMELFDKMMDNLGWCTIGRVMLVDLKAGSSIDRHVDEGAYADYYSRIHCVIHSEEGNIFQVDDETKRMKDGEVWQFNHHKQHEVSNHSESSRIHMIVDIKRE